MMAVSFSPSHEGGASHGAGLPVGRGSGHSRCISDPFFPDSPSTRRVRPCQLEPLTPILQRLAQILDSPEAAGERKRGLRLLQACLSSLSRHSGQSPRE